MRGIPGALGPPGIKGEPGPPGMNGSSGRRGLPGCNYVGGSTYTHWGVSSCAGVSGTELVYDGIAAGTPFTYKGGGANPLCLPHNPVYSSFENGTQDKARLGAIEYHLNFNFGTVVTDDNARCAVCRTTRPTTVMIPATVRCPTGWTREYYGYLMSTYKELTMSTFVCVDQNAAPLPGGSGHDVAHDWYMVEALCNVLPCPPYNNFKELTCVVCSK